MAITDGGWGRTSGLSLSCETDFAAKSDAFLTFTRAVLGGLPTSFPPAPSLFDPPITTACVTGDPALSKLWDEAVLTVRENMSVRNGFCVENSSKYYASYVHNKLSGEGGCVVGKAGAVVELSLKEPTGADVADGEKLDAVGRKVRRGPLV